MQEERKRSNSVLSSGSIISTASSNSHKRGKGGRNKDQTASLQVAGMKLGSNRKAAYGKYEKSPFINISGGRPSNGGNGNGDIILSIAGRKKEM